MEIRVDGRDAQSWFGSMFREQLPFAQSLAMNRTGKAVQDAIRLGIGTRFTVRRAWVLDGIQITHFSDKHDSPMRVTIELDPARGFLAKFEAGGVKSGSAAVPIAIPSTALRPNLAYVPPLQLYPKNLRLIPRRGVTGIVPAKHHLTARGVDQIKGKERTFVLDQTMFGVRVTGVYQRTGPGPHDIRLLWTYKDRIPIPARLRFEATALDTVMTAWPSIYAEAFRQAVRTAK